MKNLFQKEIIEEVLTRIEHLTPDTPARWGVMNVAQMLAHCTESIDMATGTNKPTRMLLGRIFGKLFRPVYSNAIPFMKNLPTAKSLRIRDKRDFNNEKEKLITKLKQFSKGGEAVCTSFPHPLLGRLTPNEWSVGTYKHLDHHLRQFGV